MIPEGSSLMGGEEEAIGEGFFHNFVDIQQKHINLRPVKRIRFFEPFEKRMTDHHWRKQ